VEIIFTDITKVISKKYFPKPASSHVPDWYKEQQSYLENKKIPNGKGGNTATIKRCMPVFDAITIGYMLVTPVDVWVKQEKIEGIEQSIPYYEWSNLEFIDFHPVEQAPNHPQRNGHVSYPKFINPWAIKTPKGYSCHFTAPLHQDNIFTILDGVVDTDTYTANVNFPFVLNDATFEGLIPAGTPMAQIIPFKRDKWKMKLGTDNHIKENNETLLFLKSKIFDGYKLLFRQPKEFN
jgi:hypothetical protein